MPEQTPRHAQDANARPWENSPMSQKKVTGARILVVEDDQIAGLYLQEILVLLGYSVPVIATSGIEAVHKAAELRPDLVLMDIRMPGEMDGIDAAVRIRREMKLPIVYLTGCADDETLERAKRAEPYGYVIKPFARADVHSAVEMALYKAGVDRQFLEQKEQLSAVLRSMTDGVMVADAAGEIAFMNPAAAEMTYGRDVSEMFLDPRTGQSDPNVLSRLAAQFASDSAPARLDGDQGHKGSLSYSAAPLFGDTGGPTGTVLTLHDGSAREERKSKTPFGRWLTR